ncbi:unnamed protein product [Phytophthora lilii]|uniref:U6 snRNA phosphodiesterase 1 n=1 Tax=Phytophthora lilii TaxID=2077276 RepID=A0A9W6WT93_9STRA|nr:unnamed protein product [Phytophthora lilii]
MDSIAAAYGSSSESSDSEASASSDSKFESEFTADGDALVGAKRKRSNEPQWKRAFPHVDGNWPSHVRIDITVTQELRKLAKDIIERAQALVGDDVKLVPFEELDSSTTEEEHRLHLSLSRPFVLTYDQIENFVDSLRAALKWRERFYVSLVNPLVLVNDDKTRSFLALRVSEGVQQFCQVLRCVDQTLERFKLPTYYKVRSICQSESANRVIIFKYVVVFAADGLVRWTFGRFIGMVL